MNKYGQRYTYVVTICLCVFFVITTEKSFSQDKYSKILCLHFSPNNSQNTGTLFWQNSEIKFKTVDTCISITINKYTRSQLLVQSEGYKLYQSYIDQVYQKKKDTINIYIEEKINYLKEVEVKTDRYYKNDTLIIDVDSVKTKPYSNAIELFDKIPGFRVESNGSVTMLGKNISRITVDGKSIYGGSPKLILEVIRSNMVKQLEVNNDGDFLTINMKLKEDKKDGLYGNVSGGIGNNRLFSDQVQANLISKSRFTNFFIGSNNINEKIISDQQENWLNHNFLLESLRGAYSVSDLAVNNSSVNVSNSQASSIPTDNQNEGVSSLNHIGLNFTNSQKKMEIISYAFYDRSKKNFYSQKNRVSNYNELNQSSNSQKSDTIYNRNFWSAINLTFKLNEYNTLKFGTRVSLRETESYDGMSSNIENVSDSYENYNSSIKHISRAINKDVNNSERFSWIHKFKKPAHVLSTFSDYRYVSLSKGNIFSNNLINSATVIKNRDSIYNDNTGHNMNIQAIYSLPLSRKILIEAKGKIDRDITLIRQKGYQFDSISYSIYRSDLSNNNFHVNNTQYNYTLYSLYKSNNFTARIGLNYIQLNSVRHISKSLSLNVENEIFSPSLNIKYQPNDNVKSYIIYDKYIDKSGNSEYFPVVDSSDIQLIRFGNPFLTPVNVTQLEINTSISTIRRGLFSVSLKYEHRNVPVSPNTTIDGDGITSLSFSQILPSNQISSSFFWYKFNKTKPYSFYIFSTISYKKSFILFNERIENLQNYFSSISGSLNWKVNENFSLKLESRSIIYTQKTIYNYRENIISNMTVNFSKNAYIEFHNDFFVGKSSGANSITYNLLNLNFHYFLLKSKRLKTSLCINNAINISKEFTNSISLNTRIEESYNRLPRYFLFSLNLYLDKWRKKSD